MKSMFGKTTSVHMKKLENKGNEREVQSEVEVVTDKAREEGRMALGGMWIRYCMIDTE